MNLNFIFDENTNTWTGPVTQEGIIDVIPVATKEQGAEINTAFMLYNDLITAVYNSGLSQSESEIKEVYSVLNKHLGYLFAKDSKNDSKAK